MAERVKVPWGARLVAAGALTFGAATSVECGGGTEKSIPTSEPTESETTVVVETATPTATATEAATPTPTEIPVAVLEGEVELKEEVMQVYDDVVEIPSGACTVEMIDGLIDEIYGIYNSNPNKFSLAGGLASVYAELSFLAERDGNAEAARLAARIKQTVEELIVQHLKERNLPAENKSQLVDAWNENVRKKVADIEDGGECSISLVPDEYRGN